MSLFSSDETAGLISVQTATLILNVVLSVLFGFLHQGGVVPSLLILHRFMHAPDAGNTTAVIYWKTYMPPRHLLSIRGGGRSCGTYDSTVISLPCTDESFTPAVVDLAGSSKETLKDTLSRLATPESSVVYLVTPPFAILDLDVHLKSCLSLRKAVMPHLDLDHIGENVAVGWPDGMSLGIYAIPSECLRVLSSIVA